MKKFDWYMIGGASKLEDEKARLKIRKLGKPSRRKLTCLPREMKKAQFGNLYCL